jgi:anti-anti-sigma factor
VTIGMGSLAQLRFDHEDWLTIAHIEGEIDLSNASELENSISNAVANDAAGLVVDLADVRYLDSSGVSLLFNLARRVARRQQQLGIVVPADTHVREILSLTGASEALSLYDTLAEASRRTQAGPDGPE